jgi:hypothetical protein
VSAPQLPPLWHRKLSKRYGSRIGALLKLLVFRQVRRTRPIAVDPAAQVEIHSLVCHRDVDLYLLAVKSLPRFRADLAVVVHDDGTLTPADRTLVERQLLGANVIGRAVADDVVSAALADWPECRRFRAARATSPQLFDLSLLARARRLIGLDSDVLFVREPTELLAWLEEDADEVLYNQEAFGTQIGRTMRRLDIPCHGDLNSGFMAFYRDMVSLELTEQHLARLRGEPKAEYTQGYLDVCLYHSRYRATPLPPERYQIYTGQGWRAAEAAVMVHFISYLRFAQPHYPRLALRVIGAL